MKNRVLLIGGFHKATALANSLIENGYKITIINENYEDCLRIAEDNRITVVHGDGSKPDVLADAESQQNEIVIAMTQQDEDNFVICQLCKKKFNIKKTVSLLNDPQKTEFFYSMGIDSVVCTFNTLTGIIEQHAFLDKIATVLPIDDRGKIGIVEMQVPSTSPCIGKHIFEIDLPKEVIIGCILRGEISMVPKGDTSILAGDRLILISAKKDQECAIKVLTGR